MPYIKADQRPPLDAVVAFAVSQGLHAWSVGELNYLITLLLIEWVHLISAGYARYSAARGVLQDVTDEFYRRWMVPYEDKKREENGDVV